MDASVILITHRLQDLFEVCDRIMVLYEGQNVAERDIRNTSLEDLVRLIVADRGHAATPREHAGSGPRA